MTRSLPSKPSLEQLKKQAKDLLKAFKAGKSETCDVLRYHYRFARTSNENILKAEVTLQEIQHALALDYGFKSWKELKAFTEKPSSKGGAPKQTTASPLVQALIEEAARRGASDIHIDWIGGVARPQLRVDGQLVATETQLPETEGQATIDQFKQLSALDTEVRDRPQTGRAMLKVHDGKMDLRIQVVPYIAGESVVARIAPRSDFVMSLEDQGLSPEQLERLRGWAGRPNGIIVMSGPTGCGITTTMYSLLHEIVQRGVCVSTAEDPVEAEIPGVNQQQIDPNRGITYVEALRSQLRQDPDVLMVGECRDTEVLEVLLRVAQTGHLALTTLHSSGTVGAVRRLLDMGAEPYVLNSTLIGIMAQRLVRKICDSCREEYEPEAWARESLGRGKEQSFFRGRGCDKCHNTGYRGRTAVHELLEMNDDLRLLFARNAGLDDLAAAAARSGLKTLRQDGLEKAAQGITTVNEVLRVCG